MGGLGIDRHFHHERCTFISAFACDVNRSAMKLKQCLGDGKPKSQASKLLRDLATALLKRVKDVANCIGADTNPSVVHANRDPVGGGISREDTHPPAGGREFDRVFQNVPKDLLEAGRISLNKMLASA